METVVRECLEGLEFGDLQTERNMAVLPLFSEAKAGRRFVVMSEALEAGVLTITEVDAGGSVPELKVRNAGDQAVLLLDGEELAGAKQNRVLNTTILVEKHSEIIVPVSCTEHGRWRYTSREFSDSGNVMAPAQRMRKARSVSESLRKSRGHRSDQRQVWDDIAETSREAGVQSPTGAMRDVFESRDEDLTRYAEAFPCLDGQRGVLAFINGTVAGFELLAREHAYRELHDKLIRSYAMQSSLRRREEAPEASAERARAFVDTVLNCREEPFDSPGLGTDLRYRNDHVVGSALVYWKATVHAAFFKAEGSRDQSKLRSYRRRRRFRM